MSSQTLAENGAKEFTGRRSSMPRAQTPLIELAGVEQVYRMGKVDYGALRGVDLEIEVGEMVAVVGPSGSGKTTILNLVTGIDRPTAGDGHGRRAAPGRDERGGARRLAGRERRDRLPVLPAAADPVGARERGAAARLRALAARSGSGSSGRGTTSSSSGSGTRATTCPAELSGGEQQRVAIARSLAADPGLIVGDEPTGNLDTVTAAEMFELLERLNDEGKTVLYVTHDRELAGRAQRVVTIRDGLVVAG